MKFNPQLKLACHKELVSFINGESIVPINIEISPCGICNAGCPWCFYKNKQSKTILDPEVLKKFLLEAQNLGVKAITWTGGGEPTLHPKFKEITNEVTIDQGLITNGLLLPKYDPSIFTWIRVSKTDVDWNIEALERIRECQTVGLCINYTGDQDEVLRSLNLVYLLGLDYLQVRPALNTNGEKTKIELPNITDPKLELTPYKFSESNKDRTYKHCKGYHFVPFLWEDGTLAVCAYKRHDNNYNLGNIYNESLLEIIDKMPTNVDVDSTCQICCKNHEINTLIHTLNEMENINFV